MTSLEEWADRRAICELKAHNCRLMDSKDWNGYRELFTEDYELDTSGAGGGPPIRRSRRRGRIDPLTRLHVDWLSAAPHQTHETPDRQ